MSAPSNQYDAVVIGAGMAGASLAAELAPAMSVLLIEMESTPGYHSTGRSVAFWSESYGGPHVRPLTRASRAMLEAPDRDFSERSFLSARGALHIGRDEDTRRRDAVIAEFGDDNLFMKVGSEVLQGRIAGLRREWTVGLEEPSTRDIDVAGLHAAYLRAFRRHGGIMTCGARLQQATKTSSGDWQLNLSSGMVRAALIINAAGAWADEVAICAGVAPRGIAPLLRTVVQLRVDPPAPDHLPLILDLSENFYFKPVGGGRIWLTPHDEKATAAGDVAPSEIDIAIAIERLQSTVDWRIEAVERRWAGLRSFAPDRLPIYGFDASVGGFFWFAGQGGFGIQTAPAAAKLTRAQILGVDEPAVADLDAGQYSPSRFA